jgi:hypothetical protein
MPFGSERLWMGSIGRSMTLALGVSNYLSLKLRKTKASKLPIMLQRNTFPVM